MQPSDVSESASTTSRAVEIQVDLSKVTTRLDILQMVEALENYLKTVETDPAA